MKVGSMDLGKLRVEPPDGWRAVEHVSYVRPGFWRGDYELHPDPTADFFSEPLDELRAELRKGVDEFRADCAPRVGPEVTCRGEVIAEPVRVPVDPSAYARRRLNLAAKVYTHAFREAGAVLERVGRAFRNAYGGEQ